MASKKYLEISGLSTEELNQQIEESKHKLKKLRFNHAVSPLDNPNVLGDMKRYIARIRTELRKRELENKAK
jgi:large subunit ribosomal protein L29